MTDFLDEGPDLTGGENTFKKYLIQWKITMPDGTEYGNDIRSTDLFDEVFDTVAENMKRSYKQIMEKNK